MVIRPRLHGRVEKTLEGIQQDHGYPTMNETIRHVLREAYYDV